MNKIIKTWAMAAVTAFALAHLAAPARAAVGDFDARKGVISSDARGQLDINRKWSIKKLCRVNKSTTCVVCESSNKKGFIVDIDVSSGAVGGFTVALDTGAIPSGHVEPAASGAGALLARQKTCEYTLATVDTNKGSCGRREFMDGQPFEYGLTLCAKNSDTDTIVGYYVNEKP